MATKSTINLQTDKGIKSIYCHWDGYPEHHLPILKECYNTFDKVEALINLGDLSVLSESIECPRKHTFDNPIDGYCVAYGRDRGEKNVNYKIHHKIEDIDMQDYNYIFISNFTCKNCGAVNASGSCIYCGTISLKKWKWEIINDEY
jgi:hypothetical protein